jgi:hypothetical protein
VVDVLTHIVGDLINWNSIDKLTAFVARRSPAALRIGRGPLRAVHGAAARPFRPG